MIKEKDKTVTLQTFSDMLIAKMVQEKLKENGIESFLNDENVMGLDPVSGVEVKIFERDIEAARKVILS